MIHFTLKPIGGGFHPVITAYINGTPVEALIDTGANITLHNMEHDVVEGELRIGLMTCNVKLRKYEIVGGYKLLIGSDLFAKTGAVIDYVNKKIMFNGMK